MNSNQLSHSRSAGSKEISASNSVKLVSGRLSENELAAIAVAVSTYSSISRQEAEHRQLLAKAKTTASAWNYPGTSMRFAGALRNDANHIAWLYSHR